MSLDRKTQVEISNGMKVTAIVPAAGKGKRMGGVVSKPYLLIGGRPVLSYVLASLDDSEDIQDVIVVTRQEEIDFCKINVIEKYNLKKVSAVISGGEERQDSVYRGLKNIKNDPDIILIHDGVRPFLNKRLLKDVISCASEFKAAISAIPVRDTLKRVDSRLYVNETISRDSLWYVQTPQAFDKMLITEAYEKAYRDKFYATDDAGLVERCGYRVRIVAGTPENIKITTPEDLTMAEAILELSRW